MRRMLREEGGGVEDGRASVSVGFKTEEERSRGKRGIVEKEKVEENLR